MPGGDETTNRTFYKTDEELLDAIDRLQPGMSEDRVFSALARRREDFTKLDRSEILKVLYGGSDAELESRFEEQESTNHLLQSLYGYRFTFKIVKREHGFTSPIRIRTDESGYNYTVNLIFRDGVLFEKPAISGGVVNNTRSGTLFDYLNPGLILNRTVE